jgi:hypothetical protein
MILKGTRVNGLRRRFRQNTVSNLLSALLLCWRWRKRCVNSESRANVARSTYLTLIANPSSPNSQQRGSVFRIDAVLRVDGVFFLGGVLPLLDVRPELEIEHDATDRDLDRQMPTWPRSERTVGNPERGRRRAARSCYFGMACYLTDRRIEAGV